MTSETCLVPFPAVYRSEVEVEVKDPRLPLSPFHPVSSPASCWSCRDRSGLLQCYPINRRPATRGRASHAMSCYAMRVPDAHRLSSTGMIGQSHHGHRSIVCQHL
ncbi:hypothetical protein ACRALDRAFT_1061145, partial [Sodiomyces alcalophilus JCM 7366]|uniref:uncharacterized protein n=1 Tax=Sodiomyces alcalophilus JCM 7366 TaxID=591952 RepID=UPI0039B42587